MKTLESSKTNALAQDEIVVLDLTGTAKTNERTAVTPLSLLWRQNRFILWFLVRCTVCLTVITFLIPNYYESTVRFLPPDSSNASILSAMMGRSMPGSLGLAGDLLGVQNQNGYFISILKSRSVQDQLIDRFHLQTVYSKKTLKATRKKLGNNTTIDEDRKSSQITLSVTDRSRERARDLAAAYIEELNRRATELNTSAAHRERLFIENRLKSVKTDLDSASKDFSEFSSKNVAIDIKEQGRAMVEAAAVIQGQLVAAQSELQGLEQIYTDNNVRVRSLRGRISELQKQLDKMGGKDTAAGTSRDTSSYPTIRELPLLGVPWADLYRRVKVQETVYELLTQQYEIAKIQEAKELPVVRVLDSADFPEEKSGPPRLLIVTIGIIAFLILGCTLVLATVYLEQMDESKQFKMILRDVDDAMDRMIEKSSTARRIVAYLRTTFLPPVLND